MKKSVCVMLATMLLLCLLPHVASAEEQTWQSMPDHYFEACPEQGELHLETFQENKGNDELLVWTPYGYDPTVRYEVVMLINGGGGDLHDWIDKIEYVKSKPLPFQYIYDWITYEDLCKPFIVCTISNRSDKLLAAAEIVRALSYVAAHYSTYAKDGSYASIIQARKHFTVGGLSNGCITAHYFNSYKLEYAANYICLSSSRNFGLREPFESYDGQYRINKYFGACGKMDGGMYQAGINDYRYLEPYADASVFVTYDYGHDWSTWGYAIYDAILYICEKPPYIPIMERLREVLKTLSDQPGE